MDYQSGTFKDSKSTENNYASQNSRSFKEEVFGNRTNIYSAVRSYTHSVVYTAIVLMVKTFCVLNHRRTWVLLLHPISHGLSISTKFAEMPTFI